MKKIISLVLIILTLALVGCTQEKAPAPTAQPTPAATPAPSAAPTAQPTVEPSAEPAQSSALELAEGCVGGSVEELFAAIGEPESSDYAPSCLGSGEDGILEYPDFQVYTYKDANGERVETVLPR